MASIFRRKGDTNWKVDFTDYDLKTGESFHRELSARTSNKAEAGDFAATLERQALAHREEARERAELIRRGALNPKIEAMAEQGGNPIAEHVDAFKAMMEDKGCTANHVNKTCEHIARICKHPKCDFQMLSDMDADKVVEAIRAIRGTPTRRKTTIAVSTVHSIVTSFKSFSRWLYNENRTATDLMKNVKKGSAKAEVKRGAFSDAELTCLLSSTAQAPHRYKLSGADRAMLYRLAVETGFRANELRSMERGNFDLGDVERASVTVHGAYTKNGKEATLPLRSDFAAELQSFLSRSAQDGPALPVPRRTADMIHEDMADARTAWLQAAESPAECYERFGTRFLLPVDESGFVRDFHSLRHTGITRVVRSGASMKIAQDFARHSDPKLTANIYTHLHISDIRAALENVPPVATATPVEAQALRATGTENALGDSPTTKNHTNGTASESRFLSIPVDSNQTQKTVSGDGAASKTPASPAENDGFSDESGLSSTGSGPLAQRLEQGTHNPLVQGSNP